MGEENTYNVRLNVGFDGSACGKDRALLRSYCAIRMATIFWPENDHASDSLCVRLPLQKNKGSDSDVDKVPACLTAHDPSGRLWEWTRGACESVCGYGVYICGPWMVASFLDLQHFTITGKHQQRASGFNSGWAHPGGSDSLTIL